MKLLLKNIDVKALKLYHAPFMLNPNLIDPEVFAAQSQQLTGTVLLSELDERVWAHEYLADKHVTVTVSLQGGRDRWQRLFLDLAIQADLSLLCQRCMQPLPVALAENVRIVLFADEDKLDEAMMSDDELEGMVLTQELNVCELVEDQILMALPYAPRHEQCANETLANINQDKPNPFAVLAGLKSNKQ